MKFIISFIFTFVVDLNWAKNSSEILTDNVLKDIKGKSVSTSQVLKDIEPKLNSLWSEDPMSKLVHQSQFGSEWIHQEPFRQPHTLTKLSKTIQRGFNPLFRKSDFDFERRNKPITLVAIRKNGLAQRKATYKATSEPKSGDVAELQSPYNDIGAFWNEMGNA